MHQKTLLSIFSLAVVLRTAVAVKNSFNLATTTVNLTPNPGVTAAQKVSLYDEKFTPATPTSSWGVCTSQSTAASITLSSTTPVKGRSILTLLSSDQTTGTSISVVATLSDGTQLSEYGHTTNFQIYSNSVLQFTSVTLSISSTTPTALCTPEVLVTDEHILYGMAGLDSSAWTYIVDYTHPSGYTIVSTSTQPEVENSNWLLDSNCYTQTLNSTLQANIYSYVAPDDGLLTQIPLITSYFLVIGQQNTHTNLQACSSIPTLDFATGTYTFSGIASCKSVSSTLTSTNGNAGLIANRIKFFANSAGTFQLCRLIPLGYASCFIQTVTDTTSVANSYFISAASPKTALQKVFSASFQIDSSGYYQNTAFCSYGVTATAACQTCPSTVTPNIVIGDDGTVTLSIQTTQIANFGVQTFALNVLDSRNTIQTTAVTTQFSVDFTTCTLSVTQPSDQNYVLSLNQDTLTLVTTESDTCNYVVACSMDVGAPTWVQVSTGCTIVWQATNTALAGTTYNVPILITYAPSPATQQYYTSFGICISLDSFTVTTPITYTIGDSQNSQTLAATSTCGYSVTYAKDLTTATQVSWVTVSGTTVSWHTTDITIVAAQYDVVIIATFGSSPVTTVSTTLSINLQACAESISFTQPVDQDYTIGDPFTYTLVASDSSPCGYTASCSYSVDQTILQSQITQVGCSISWQITADSFLISPKYLITYTVTLGSTVQQPSFYINMKPCIPTYTFDKAANQTYQVRTDQGTQTLTYALTSSGDCGYTPICQIKSSPSWVQTTDTCIVTWQSSSTSLTTPSNNQVIVSLSYFDYANTAVELTFTDFWIYLTSNLDACQTAYITTTSTSSVQLTQNSDVVIDFTPTDSVSDTFKKANYCGDYVLVLSDSYPSWVIVQAKNFVVTFTQTAYGEQTFTLTFQFSLKDFPTIESTQTIEVEQQNCQVESFIPNQESVTLNYVIGSGLQSIPLPSYTTAPSCANSFQYFLSFEQAEGEQLDSCQISQSMFQVSIEDDKFAGELLTFVVTATLSDESQTQNSDLIVTVNIQQDSGEDQNSTQSQDGQDQATMSPIFIHDLLEPEDIPCLSLDQADQWEYQTSMVLTNGEDDIVYSFSCPGLDSIFLISLEDSIFTIALNTDSNQPYPGEYPATFTLFYKEKQIKSHASTVFTVDCDAKFATAKLFTRPEPQITQVTGSGEVSIRWNTTMIQSHNVTQLQNSVVKINGTTFPSFKVEILPGSFDEETAQLRFNYSISQITNQFITLQLTFQNPAYISQSKYSQDKVQITFNDPAIFKSAVNQMSAQSGLVISANLPRQQLGNQVTLNLKQAVGASKGAMLASVGMPYLLSLVLSQVLSVIRSLTIIVHMMTINVLLPANCVSFFSVLAPLVMFDLLPTQSLANSIFRFPELSSDPAFSSSFNSLGYGSMLIVENMGSMFFMIFFYIVGVAVLLFFKAKTQKKLQSTRVGKKVLQMVSSFTDGAFWNTPISFVYEAYFIICVMSFIGTQRLIFREAEMWSQVFCSVLALLGAALSVIFPLSITILYFKKIKNVPSPSAKNLDNYDRHMTYGTFDLNEISKIYFTEDQYLEFCEKFGCLVSELDLKKVGVKVTIFTILFDLIRRLVLALSICYLTEYPFFLIFVFNFTTQFYVMFIVYHQPMISYTEQVRAIINELTILTVNYHLICLTDFVSSIEAQSTMGNSLLLFIMLNGFLNLCLSVNAPIHKLQLHLRRFYYKKLGSGRNKKPARVQANSVQQTNGQQQQKANRQTIIEPRMTFSQNFEGTFNADLQSSRANFGSGIVKHQALSDQPVFPVIGQSMAVSQKVMTNEAMMQNQTSLFQGNHIYQDNLESYNLKKRLRHSVSGEISLSNIPEVDQIFEIDERVTGNYIDLQLGQRDDTLH